MPYIDMAVFFAGMALGVWQHDRLVSWWQGAEAFAANLKTKAAAIEAELAALKAKL